MKKLFLTLLIALFAFAGFSQGNKLVFNQILTFSGHAVNGGGLTTIGTVPTGRAWKIEYIAGGNTSAGWDDFHFNISGNDVDVGALFRSVSTGNTYSTYIFSPVEQHIWLKAGDVIQLTNGDTNPYFISIIEFLVEAN